VIEFLAMAFLVAQPTPPAAATDGGTRPPMLGSVALNNPVEITAKLITGERNSAPSPGTCG
jgi:lipopolysaccharide export system protein LptA